MLTLWSSFGDYKFYEKKEQLYHMKIYINYVQ